MEAKGLHAVGSDLGPMLHKLHGGASVSPLMAPSIHNVLHMCEKGLGDETKPSNRLLLLKIHFLSMSVCFLLGGLWLQSNMASSWSARSSNMLPMSSRMVPADFTELALPSEMSRWFSLFSTASRAAARDVLV